MFGNNPIEPNINDRDGQTLQLVEGSPFSTIQGEGPWAGHRATFVRLHGCNLRCHFCDTEFSDPKDQYVPVEHLANAIAFMPAQLVVITGGEPLRQNILPLVEQLNQRLMKVQIETAGTLWIPGLEFKCDIVVCPKTPTIDPNVRRFAKAFKYIISASDEFDGFVPITNTQRRGGARGRVLAEPNDNVPVYLYPMDEYDEAKNKENARKTAELAMRYGVIAGVQMHKIWSVE